METRQETAGQGSAVLLTLPGVLSQAGLATTAVVQSTWALELLVRSLSLNCYVTVGQPLTL